MKTTLMALFLIIAPAAFASAPEQIIFETYSEEVDERELAEARQELLLLDTYSPRLKSQKSGLFTILSRGYKMISVGLDTAKLFQAGKPSVNTSFKPIHVLPYENGSIVHPMRLSNASELKGRTFTVIGKSLVGIEVLRFEYTLMYQTGTYKGGRYIMNAFIKAQTKLLWGNNFDAKMDFMGMSNKGTANKPIAMATLKITYKGTSLFVSREVEEIIQLDALGNIRTM